VCVYVRVVSSIRKVFFVEYRAAYDKFSSHDTFSAVYFYELYIFDGICVSFDFIKRIVKILFFCTRV